MRILSSSSSSEENVVECLSSLTLDLLQNTEFKGLERVLTILKWMKLCAINSKIVAQVLFFAQEFSCRLCSDFFVSENDLDFAGLNHAMCDWSNV